MTMEGQPETGKVTEETPKGNAPPVQPTDHKAPAESGVDNGAVYDLKDAPPEVKPTLEYHQKRMQAEYTKRLQKLSEREKAAATLEQKAKAWDSSLSHPKVKKALMEAAGQTQAVEEDTEQPGEIDSVDKLLAAAEKRAERKLDDKLSRLEPILQGLVRENRELRRNVMSKELPEFEKYRDDVDRIMTEKPNLTEREAYILASHEDQVLNAERRALETKRAEAKNSLASFTEGGDEPVITDEAVASIPEGASMEEVARRLFAGRR